jgi:hypothetical protein
MNLNLIVMICASFVLQSCFLRNADKPASSDKQAMPVNTTAVGAIENPILQALQGRWRSQNDPAIEIEIKGDQYITFQDGLQLVTETVEAFENCPRFCFGGMEAAAMPCFVTKGEFDATCYAIVKLEGDMLVCNLIGGSGESLTFQLVH